MIPLLLTRAEATPTTMGVVVVLGQGLDREDVAELGLEEAADPEGGLVVKGPGPDEAVPPGVVCGEHRLPRDPVDPPGCRPVSVEGTLLNLTFRGLPDADFGQVGCLSVAGPSSLDAW